MKIYKMGHRGLKIGSSGINRDGFFMKITFPRSVCVKNITFDRFLKIFDKLENVPKNDEKNSLFKIDEKACSTYQKIEISID